MNESKILHTRFSKQFLLRIGIFCLSFVNSAHATGLQSHYSEVADQLSNLKLTSPQMVSNDVMLKCWALPENELYMGVEQRIHIQAPLASVVKVMDAVNEYVDLFPGYKKVELRNPEANRFTVFFEQKIPVFFVPNIKFEMLYEKDTSTEGRVVYRYHLKEVGKVKASDGFVTLIKTDTNETDYIEYDFMDAEWGMAGALGKDKLWSEVVEGLYWSDLSVKAKSQKPELSAEDARSFAKEKINKDRIKECFKNRKPWLAPLSL